MRIDLNQDLPESPHAVSVHIDMNCPQHDTLLDLNSSPQESNEIAMDDSRQDVDIISPENEDYWSKLEFSCLPNCRKFYKKHAKKAGFNMRKQYATIGRKSKIPEYVKFVCNREGFKVDSANDPKNKTLNPDAATIKKKVKKQVAPNKRTVLRAETRTGCKAHIYFRWSPDKKVYYIQRWDEVHNHEMHEEDEAFMLKCNRSITDEQGLFAENAQRVGLTLRSSYELMCIQAGGRESVGFLKQDLKNHLNRKRQKDMKRGEGTKLLEHFRQRAFNSPLFFYDIEVDSDERIANIFWADERMRTDYASFGDVLTFDTTFRTNKAYRPLAVFIGFNHHRETCIFGAALLFDETAESFKWLFTTFLRCMGGKHPVTIFTDQDAAMAVAIPHEFPNTYHGLCTWHLMQNGMKNMGSLYTSEFSQRLRNLMYDVELESEFEALWCIIKGEFPSSSGSDGHWWLTRIYQKRRQWAWAWMRHQFTAGIRLTQLVESFNATIKKFLQSDYHIDEFFMHFDRMIENTRMKERQSDFDAIEKLWHNDFPSSSLMNHAAKLYTEKVFAILHKQYCNMLSYRAVPARNGGIDRCQQFMVYQILNGQRHDERDVFIDTNKMELRCSCLLFENFGILCCHILRVMDVVGSTSCDTLMTIPEKYILKRWTLKAKAGIHKSDARTSMDGNNVAYDPHQVMVMKLLKLANQACSRVDFHEKIAPEVDKVCKMMDELIAAENCVHTNQVTDQDVAGSTNPVLKVRDNPIKSRKRLKSSVELRNGQSSKKRKNVTRG